MDPDPAAIAAAATVGADRIELYTDPYARAFASGEAPPLLRALRGGGEGGGRGRPRRQRRPRPQPRQPAGLLPGDSRSSPRSASATRSPRMRSASASRPRSRPICGRSGGSRSPRSIDASARQRCRLWRLPAEPSTTAPETASARGEAGMDLVERLARTYTGVVHDVMRAMGLRDFTLPPEIRPLFPGRRWQASWRRSAAGSTTRPTRIRPCSAGPACCPRPEPIPS